MATLPNPPIRDNTAERMIDWCDELSGPYRVTHRDGVLLVSEVFGSRADLFACLDAMTPEDRMDATVESPLLDITDTNPGDYVWDALRHQCGDA